MQVEKNVVRMRRRCRLMRKIHVIIIIIIGVGSYYNGDGNDVGAATTLWGSYLSYPRHEVE